MKTDLRAVAEALPNYEIGEELGRGGFGVVHAGRQRGLGRSVAIKQLPPYLASDPTVRRRFVAEAQLLGSLDHPHIVPVYDYVERDGLCLLVMECLPGGTVWETFQSQGLSFERSCAIAIASASGLHHAHSRGILHRDVKPENLLFNSENHLKVTDFGIARVIGGREVVATEVGGIIGTPAYMAPEQAQGGDIGPAVDIYALGVMLYELLCGKLPFSQDGDAFAIVYRHINEDPMPLEKVAPLVPPPIVNVVMRSLARDPNDRYATADDFALALAEAAASCFDDHWYSRSGLRVMGSERVSSAISRGSPRLPESISLREPEANLPAIVPPAFPAKGGGQRVVPSAVAHVVGEADFSDKPQPLVAVRQIIEVPPSGRQNLLPLATAVLTVLMVIVAFVGIGSASSSKGALPAGTALAGKAIASNGSLTIDLGHPMTVHAPVTAKPQFAQLSLTLDHVRLASSDRTPLDQHGNGLLNISSSRHLVAGPVTGLLTLSGTDGRKSASTSFTVAPKGPGFLTIPGVIIGLLILFVLAYLESLLGPLRRLGRWRTANGIGLGLVGALTGVLVSLLAWVLGQRQPDVTTVICCAVVGSVWGVLLGLSVTRWGLRRRIRRLNKRYQLAS